MSRSNTDHSSRNIVDRPLCKYFASNCCSRGDLCLFSHDRNAKADMTCKYYLAGHCEYGKVCRYDHIKPKPNLPTSDYSPSSNLPSTSMAAIGAATKLNNREEMSASLDSSISPFADSRINAWSKPLVGKGNNQFVEDLRNELECINDNEDEDFVNGLFSSPAEIPLCPYYEIGYCMYGDMCTFIHGDNCSMCDTNVLHPYNEVQRVEHHRQCLAEHESAMEAAFAEARSIDKQCGICMEPIVERQLRFGILENCKHCFCLACIRKWRQRSEQFASKTVRSCPECRVVSDYVIPSSIWVDEIGEKQKLIDTYRTNMKQKECKYTLLGRVDDCPFGNKCFYKHQKLDGTLAEGESPRELQKRRRLLVQINNEFLGDSTDEEDSILAEVIEQIGMSLNGSRGTTLRN